MSKIFETHVDDLQFFFVYIREAHPIDGPRPNKQFNVKDPKTNDERRELALKFVKDFELDIPVLLDEIDDKTSTAYAALPDRLFLVGEDGKIAYAGEKGPRGFDPDELTAAIKGLSSSGSRSSDPSEQAGKPTRPNNR